jgi:dienelactone hydrolase
MKPLLSILIAALCVICPTGSLRAQASHRIVDSLLQQKIQSPDVIDSQLSTFLLTKVQPLPPATSAEQWTNEEAKIRGRGLAVLYHGWPKAWIDRPPRFEKVGVIEGRGYRIIKYRYQIVPGFESTALLYEPEHKTGKMPAILDVNGHGLGGKAVEQKQKRCINQARRGIIALSPEFIGYGELSLPKIPGGHDYHDYVGLLDLAGVSGAGVFYFAMERALDFLYNDPDVDRSRIGVTGLSGGGYQSMVLSALDPRIGPAVPVAGFATATTAVEHPDYFDAEQNAADLRMKAGYADMMAIRAPRPTLLINNSMDNCCFRADIVKQGIYDDIKPYYKLYGKPDNLQFHENLNPGTHNYGLDNREASYRFFDSAFGLGASSKEFPDTDSEVLNYQDLVVGGLPKDNFTLVTLAQHFAKSIHHEVPADHGAAWAESQRKLLRDVVRYTPVSVNHAWPVNATHQKDVESTAYRFHFSNGLSATGLLIRSVTAPEDAPTTILFSDEGMPSTAVDVGNQVDRGRRVLVFEPIFFGQSSPVGGPGPDLTGITQLVNSMGRRPLGLEAAQLVAVVQWLAKDLDHGSPTPGSPAAKANPPAKPVRIITTGPRSETVAIVAAALEPKMFSQMDARKAIPSLSEIFTRPITYFAAPDLMCLDLYKDFDFNTLSAMASSVKIDLSATQPKPIFW